jgi:hypothetical protein
MNILDKDECVIEHNKYVGIGGTILSTAVLAFMSSSYALFMVFGSIPLAICFGLVWGAIIFNLDRYIVSTLRKKRVRADLSPLERVIAKRDEFARAFPRMLLAIFISLIITKPIELRLFESEITAQISKDTSVDMTFMHDRLKVEFSEIEDINKLNDQLRQQITDKQTQRNDLNELIVAERKGVRTSRTTGRAGIGPVYKERERALGILESELAELKRANDAKIEAGENRIAILKSQQQERAASIAKDIENAKGLLARLNAMNTLSENSSTIAWASRFLILLFILLETAPIIVKLFSDRGPYDDIYETMEHKVAISEENSISDTDDDIGTRSSLNKELNALWLRRKLKWLEHEYKLSSQTMDSLFTLAQDEIKEAQVTIARQKVAHWRKAELEQMQNASSRNSHSRNGAGPHVTPPDIPEAPAAPAPDIVS